MKVYVVTMWQDDEYGSGHSYIVDVYDNEEKAKAYCEKHRLYADYEEYEVK